MMTIVWIVIALFAIAIISFFAYMAYKDEKEIDDDLRKADGVRNLYTSD